MKVAAIAVCLMLCLFAQCVIVCDLQPPAPQSHCPQHQPDHQFCQDGGDSFDAVAADVPPPVFNTEALLADRTVATALSGPAGRPSIFAPPLILRV